MTMGCEITPIANALDALINLVLLLTPALATSLISAHREVP